MLAELKRQRDELIKRLNEDKSEARRIADSLIEIAILLKETPDKLFRGTGKTLDPSNISMEKIGSVTKRISEMKDEIDEIEKQMSKRGWKPGFVVVGSRRQ